MRLFNVQPSVVVVEVDVVVVVELVAVGVVVGAAVVLVVAEVDPTMLDVVLIVEVVVDVVDAGGSVIEVVVLEVAVIGHWPAASQSTMLLGNAPSPADGTAWHACPRFLRTQVSALRAITPCRALPRLVVPRQHTVAPGRPQVDASVARIIAFRHRVVRLGSRVWSSFVAALTHRL